MTRSTSRLLTAMVVVLASGPVAPADDAETLDKLKAERAALEERMAEIDAAIEKVWADSGGVKLLGMTVMPPKDELIAKYDLHKKVKHGPVIVHRTEKAKSYWDNAPSEGCAFWIVSHPAHAFLFNEERSPNHCPTTVRQLLEAIVANTVSPQEYEKIWDETRQRCRKQAENLKDKPADRERMLRVAEAKIPKEDLGKYTCRVVYRYPKQGGTMTTFIRMSKADFEQVRELLNN